MFMDKLSKFTGSLALCVLCTVSAQAADRQVLHGHVPKAITEMNLPAIGRPPATDTLQLSIGLPLRNKEDLDQFMKELYTPGSPNFRKFLKPKEFTEKYGPSEEDYRALVEFAKDNGLTVTSTSSNRLLLDVKASVADVERVFHVTMRLYQHPTEARTFCAPDVEPSVDLQVPILYIGGMDGYVLPRRVKSQPMTAAGEGTKPFEGGSGPKGTFMAEDIRKAYLEGVTNLTGNGQTVGLLEYSAFYSAPIASYEYSNGIPTPVNIENWEFDGASGVPVQSQTNAYSEVEIDIEMAIAMAPFLDGVIVYEMPTIPASAYQGLPPDVALNFAAVTDLANQLSSSWEYQVTPNTDQIFQEMGAQGQSFFQASGDGGGRTAPNVYSPFDDAYVTLVGGTTLTTTANGSYNSEVVWNDKYGESGGGITTNYTIPWWQEGVSMSANGGSTTQRNMPDVAIVAANVFTYYGGAPITNGGYYGTSLAAPLWAGFMALVNEEASYHSLPPVGFANPAIYAIGEGTGYSSCFNDIKSGNNETQYAPAGDFQAVTGYDLCTGWGTPKGIALINALVYPPPIMKYVKFGGQAGNGSWENPFNSLAAAVNAVSPYGGIVLDGPASSSERLTITKPVTIEAIGGPVTIGTTSTISN
jgi:subtilase family serine protease